MQAIQASEFKAKCLALMDDVARSGDVLIVTKNGRPIVELRPYSGGAIRVAFRFAFRASNHGGYLVAAGG